MRFINNLVGLLLKVEELLNMFGRLEKKYSEAEQRILETQSLWLFIPKRTYIRELIPQLHPSVLCPKPYGLSVHGWQAFCPSFI